MAKLEAKPKGLPGFRKPEKVNLTPASAAKIRAQVNAKGGR